jgi:hypothetical protein
MERLDSLKWAILQINYYQKVELIGVVLTAETEEINTLLAGKMLTFTSIDRGGI